MPHYLFTSERLGFRNWIDADVTEFAQLNADKDVMKHFPKTLSKEETEQAIKRYQNCFTERNYTYFACDLLENNEFIGFIGLAYQDFESDFTPATDIGWRLKKSAWGKGFATEGAKRCLAYAFNELNLDRIIATCTLDNSSSENVMKKIGMVKKGTFDHPKLTAYPSHQKCIWYEIKNKQHD